MLLLSLDIGTNSTLSLVADVADGGLSVVERGIAANRLGSAKRVAGSLPPELLDHNRNILKQIVARAREQGAVLVKGVGTHALRNAPNAPDFLKMAGEAGVPVEIIDGEREAALGWKGVFFDRRLRGKAALLDIGGGSSELTVGDAAGVRWSLSIPVGAVSLTRRFSSDPPSPAEIELAAAEVRNALAPWVGRVPVSSPMVAIGGAATALASLKARSTDYQPGALEGATLTLNDVRRWRDRLASLTLAERKALPGMPPARAEVIAAGAVILFEAMQIARKDRIRVSERGVLFGLALEMAQEGRRAD